MTDFINKVISMILIVILLLIAPLNMSNMSRRTQQKIEVLNTVQLFLDTVSDKGYIQESDLDDLYRKLAGTGLILSVKIEEFRTLAEGDKVVLAKTCDITYKRIDLNGGRYEIDAGNVVRLKFKEEVTSAEANMWYRIIGSMDVFEDQFSVMRR